MKSFQISRKTIRLLYSKLSIFLLLLAVLFMFQSVWRAFEYSRRAKEKELATANRLSNLKSQYEKLISDLDDLQTKRGIEKVIRQDFMMARPGERVIAVIDNEESNLDLPTTNYNDELEGKSFWNYLFFW
ncbi:MAG TPA: hypothetical protein ENN31_00535 [Candidatus Vogelbacteria bacterium]|nr:hypothetical protein [Candidatus Vogelbacteria bacterium]